MREPGDYFEDWGPWGWLWAVGLYVFLLGLLLAPVAVAGQVPAVLPFVALPGAVLLRAADRCAGDSPYLETNI